MVSYANSVIVPRITMSVLAATLFVWMTACSAQPERAGADKTAPPVSGETNSPRAVGTNKIDVCALVPKSKVEELLGSPVKSAELGRATEGTQSTAAFSECTYKLEGAQTVSLFMRRSPAADNTPEAINRVKDTMKDMTGKENVEVKDVGDTAFWTATKQLHVFQGGNIYVYVTMLGFKDDAQAKAKAIELARQALTTLPK